MIIYKLKLKTKKTKQSKTVYDFDNTLAFDTFLSRVFLMFALLTAKNNADFFGLINACRTRFMRPNKNIHVGEEANILTSRMPQDKKSIFSFMARHHPNTSVKIQTRTKLQQSEKQYKFEYLQANNITIFYENDMEVISYLMNRRLVDTKEKITSGEKYGDTLFRRD